MPLRLGKGIRPRVEEAAAGFRLGGAGRHDLPWSQRQCTEHDLSGLVLGRHERQCGAAKQQQEEEATRVEDAIKIQDRSR
jgi:hypothetical protein